MAPRELRDLDERSPQPRVLGLQFIPPLPQIAAFSNRLVPSPIRHIPPAPAVDGRTPYRSQAKDLAPHRRPHRGGLPAECDEAPRRGSCCKQGTPRSPSVG